MDHLDFYKRINSLNHEHHLKSEKVFEREYEKLINEFKTFKQEMIEILKRLEDRIQ